jgi:hypothetical protein
MIIQLITTRETIVSNPIAAREIAGELLDLQTVLFGMAIKFRLSFERAFTAWLFTMPIPVSVRKMAFEVIPTNVLFPKGRVRTRNDRVKRYATAQKTIVFHPRRLRSSITTG